MSEQQTLKVYELAKELGVTPLSLVDTLKSLNINVKNHMSELGGEELQVARTTLKPAGTGFATEPKTAKKVAPRTKKKSTDAVGTPAAVPVDHSAEKKSSSSTIIRRRTKADGATETVTQTMHHAAAAGSALASPSSHSPSETLHLSASTATHEQTHPAVHEILSEMPMEAETTEAMVEEELEAPEMQETGEALEVIESEPVETESDLKTALKEKVEAAQPSSPVKAVESVAQSTPAVPTVEQVQVKEAAPVQKQPTPPVKKERPPIAPFVRPQAPPRKSILKIVEPSAPPPRPVIKPAPPITPKSAGPAVKPVTTTQEKDGYRIIKMTKENLDQLVEEEAAKKRGGGRELEIRPEDVRFADYRKKEMVFLPKKKKIPLGKEIKKTQLTVAKAQKRVVEVHNTITVQELANALSIKAVSKSND